MRKRVRHTVWMLMICCFGVQAGYGYAGTRVDSTLTIDSSTVSVRQFDETALAGLRKNPDFQYEDQQLDLSWWQRFKRWVMYKVAELMTREGAYSVLNTVLITLGIVALIYLIMRLLGMDIAHIFSRKSLASPLDYTAGSENIHEIDFAQELQKAIETGNYRLAVRLLYLDCLKKLSDHELIYWQPAKTNAAYVNELTDTVLKTEFKQLTRQFEYVWYGDFPINQHHFMRLNDSFRQFDNELK